MCNKFVTNLTLRWWYEALQCGKHLHCHVHVNGLGIGQRLLSLAHTRRCEMAHTVFKNAVTNVALKLIQEQHGCRNVAKHSSAILASVIGVRAWRHIYPNESALNNTSELV